MSNITQINATVCVHACVRVWLYKGHLVVITDLNWVHYHGAQHCICPFLICHPITLKPQRLINEQEGAMTPSL